MLEETSLVVRAGFGLLNNNTKGKTHTEGYEGKLRSHSLTKLAMKGVSSHKAGCDGWLVVTGDGR